MSLSGSAVFSSTVRVGSRLYCWKTKPIRSRRNLVSAASPPPLISSPSTTIWPRSGRSRPAAHWSSVDFPEPDGPMTAVKLPVGRLRVTPSRAVTAPSPVPYTLLTETSRRASAARLPGLRLRSNMVIPHHPLLVGRTPRPVVDATGGSGRAHGAYTPTAGWRWVHHGGRDAPVRYPLGTYVRVRPERGRNHATRHRGR